MPACTDCKHYQLTAAEIRCAHPVVQEAASLALPVALFNEILARAEKDGNERPFSHPAIMMRLGPCGIDGELFAS